MKKIKLLIAFACIGALTFYACKKSSDGSSTAATCSDGIQNQSETGIDCGGPCTACVTTPSCSDGIKNQNETDIDCGGVCPACAPTAMTCLVDGVSWTANTSKSVSYSAGPPVNTRLTGIQTVGTTVSNIGIALQGNLTLNTSYNLITPPTGITITEKKYSTLVGATNTVYNCTAGTIKFTRLDLTNHKASGTFSGTFISTIGGTVTKQITGGVFTNLDY